jgi:membrane protein DedA with SNARE-associated domain
MIYNLFQEIALLVQYHPYLITFIVSFISEELLVFLAILSGRGILSLWIVYIVGILAVMIFDSIIFAVGRSKIGKYIEDRFFSEKAMDKKIKFAHKKRALVYLIITKFVWGTRIASIFYYSVKGMKYKKFAIYNFISLLIWSSIMLPAGWLAGRGFDLLLRVIKGTEKLLAVILIAILMIYTLHWLIKKLIIKEYKYIEKIEEKI